MISKNECNRRPDHWNSDRYSLTKEYVEKFLNDLVQDGVLTKINQYYKMVK